jgi:hypothetical protein
MFNDEVAGKEKPTRFEKQPSVVGCQQQDLVKDSRLAGQDDSSDAVARRPSAQRHRWERAGTR